MTVEPGFSVLGLGVGDIYIFLIPYSVPTCLHLSCGKHFVFSGLGFHVWYGLPFLLGAYSSRGLQASRVQSGCRAVRALLEGDSESLQPQAPPPLEPLSGIEVSHVKGQVLAFLRLCDPSKG